MLNYINEFIFEGEVLEKTLVKNTQLAYGIVVFYLLFVKWIGPVIMRNRKPFDLKYAMIFYDFGQSFVNAYLTYKITKFVWDNWHLHCKLQERPENPIVMEIITRLIWFIYLVKYSDLIDTCMFVLRKKDNQVSFLHVFHHVLNCLFCCWFIPQVENIGFYIFFGLGINTSVHVIVYFYYGVAAFGPHMNKYLWWKKYLTVFQMVQFLLILGYLSHGFITGCERMGAKEITVFIYTFTILILFIDFYRQYDQKKND